MLHDVLKFAIGIALLAFAILSAMGLVMFIPYIAQAVLFAMH
jgi:hypothetical protein